MSLSEAQLQELWDQQHIRDVIYRYCRGLDRMDKALTLSCWHPGGTDNHGPLFDGPAEDFVEWVWPIHEAMERTQHTVHNILIEIDGETAGTEAYYIVYLRTPTPEGTIDIIGGGRYCDSFEKVDGVWRIRHRQAISDWNQILPVAENDLGGAIPVFKPDIAPVTGQRDRSDYSWDILKRVYPRS